MKTIEELNLSVQESGTISLEDFNQFVPPQGLLQDCLRKYVDIPTGNPTDKTSQLHVYRFSGIVYSSPELNRGLLYKDISQRKISDADITKIFKALTLSLSRISFQLFPFVDTDPMNNKKKIIALPQFDNRSSLDKPELVQPIVIKPFTDTNTPLNMVLAYYAQQNVPPEHTALNPFTLIEAINVAPNNKVMDAIAFTLIMSPNENISDKDNSSFYQNLLRENVTNFNRGDLILLRSRLERMLSRNHTDQFIDDNILTESNLSSFYKNATNILLEISMFLHTGDFIQPKPLKPKDDLILPYSLKQLFNMPGGTIEPTEAEVNSSKLSPCDVECFPYILDITRRFYERILDVNNQDKYKNTRKIPPSSLKNTAEHIVLYWNAILNDIKNNTLLDVSELEDNNPIWKNAYLNTKAYFTKFMTIYEKILTEARTKNIIVDEETLLSSNDQNFIELTGIFHIRRQTMGTGRRRQREIEEEIAKDERISLAKAYNHWFYRQGLNVPELLREYNSTKTKK